MEERADELSLWKWWWRSVSGGSGWVPRRRSLWRWNVRTWATKCVRWPSVCSRPEPPHARSSGDHPACVFLLPGALLGRDPLFHIVDRAMAPHGESGGHEGARRKTRGDPFRSQGGRAPRDFPTTPRKAVRCIAETPSLAEAFFQKGCAIANENRFHSCKNNTMALRYLFVRFSITAANCGGDWDLSVLEMRQDNLVSLINTI